MLGDLMVGVGGGAIFSFLPVSVRLLRGEHFARAGPARRERGSEIMACRASTSESPRALGGCPVVITQPKLTIYYLYRLYNWCLVCRPSHLCVCAVLAPVAGALIHIIVVVGLRLQLSRLQEGEPSFEGAQRLPVAA